MGEVVVLGGLEFCHEETLTRWRCSACPAILVTRLVDGFTAISEYPRHVRGCAALGTQFTTAEGVVVDLLHHDEEEEEEGVVRFCLEGTTDWLASGAQAVAQKEEILRDANVLMAPRKRPRQTTADRKRRHKRVDGTPIPRGRFKCPECPQSFVKEARLADHMHTHRPYTHRSHMCEVCQKAYFTRGQLMYHARIHRDKGKYACKTCDKTFSEMYKVRQHERLHTGVQQFLCTACGACFAQKDYLYRHEMRVHSGVRKFACQECGKRFHVRRDLTNHERSHRGEKAFCCELCGKALGSHTALNIHRRMHNDDRPYVCPLCCKRFLTSGNLEKHRKLHAGIKPHVCDVCSQGFVDKPHLRRHLSIHEGPRHHQCHYCTACFTRPEVQQGFLKRHGEVCEARGTEGAVVLDQEPLQLLELEVIQDPS